MVPTTGEAPSVPTDSSGLAVLVSVLVVLVGSVVVSPSSQKETAGTGVVAAVRNKQLLPARVRALSLPKNAGLFLFLSKTASLHKPAGLLLRLHWLRSLFLWKLHLRRLLMSPPFPRTWIEHHLSLPLSLSVYLSQASLKPVR